MKKFIILLFSLLVLYGCGGVSENSSAVRTGKYVYDNAAKYELIELTFNGETHEYIILTDYSRAGLAHWEGCKYCKDKHEHEYEIYIRDTIYVEKESERDIW